MKNSIVLFICLTLCSTNLLAQDEPIRQLFKRYIKEINDLNKTKDVSRVVQYLDSAFTSNQTYIGLTGRVGRTTQDFAKFSAGMQGLTSDRDISLGLRIKEITNVFQGTDVGVLSAALTMDFTIDGTSAEKGNFTVNMIATKDSDGDTWKFVHSDNIRMVEERSAGMCGCSVFERKNGFVTEVNYPIGFEYVEKLDVFKVRTIDNVKTINVNYRQYEWEDSGKVMDVVGESKTKIGSAKDSKEMVKLILAHIYADNCVSFRLRN